MFPSNAPKDYVCPICLGVQRIESGKTLMKPSDIVFSDELVTVFINSFFMGGNAGHAIVVPNEHFESIYDLPEHINHKIADVAKNIAIGLKSAYDCDGITIRQNNEPAGDQHAFHYHLHATYNAIHPSEKRLAEPKERASYAVKLSEALSQLN